MHKRRRCSKIFYIVLCTFAGKISGKNASLKNATVITKSNIFSLKLETEAVVRRCSVKKGVLRIFANFTGKYRCQRLFFNKVGNKL